MSSHHQFSLENLSSKASSVRSRSSKSKTKYENVTPKTNSGYHVGRLLEDFDSVQRNFRFRPDEIFTRIKISLLVSLISESTFLEQHLKDTFEPAIEEPVGKDQAAEEPIGKYNSHFQFTESRNSPEKPIKESKAQSPDRPYLLLDVRDPDEFASGHIITAENYPRLMLSRANFETPSLLKYRNHASHIIVLYDSDEMTAPQVATTLIERNYQNIFVLSGGLKVAKLCFPHSLIVTRESSGMSVETAKILSTQLQQMSYRYKK